MSNGPINDGLRTSCGLTADSGGPSTQRPRPSRIAVGRLGGLTTGLPPRPYRPPPEQTTLRWLLPRVAHVLMTTLLWCLQKGPKISYFSRWHVLASGALSQNYSFK